MIHKLSTNLKIYEATNYILTSINCVNTFIRTKIRVFYFSCLNPFNTLI